MSQEFEDFGVPTVEPSAPAGQPAAAPSEPTIVLDGQTLTAAQVKEAIAYKENYNKWAASLHEKGRSINQEAQRIGPYVPIVDALAELQRTNPAGYAKLVMEAQGQPAGAMPTPTPMPGTAAPTVGPTIDPALAAKIQKLEQESAFREYEAEQRRMADAQVAWADVDKIYEADHSGQKMPPFVREQILEVLDKNRGLSDVRAAYYYALRSDYDAMRQRWAQKVVADANAAAPRIGSEGAGAPPGEPELPLSDMRGRIDRARRGFVGSAPRENSSYVEPGKT